MKIVFAGTPTFSVPSLQALIDENYTIAAVYTQPDRPAGRGQKLTPSPVKQLAQQHQIPLYQPMTLRDTSQQQILEKLKPDLMIVVAYGLLLPESILTIPQLGCINVHASLLPRWRGAAPIQRAILAGDTETGVSIMQMDVGLDTGAVWYQQTCTIHQTDTNNILHDRLSHLGAETLLMTLKKIQKKTLTLKIQNEMEACYANKIRKEEGRINWQLSAIEIDRAVRALNPWPGTYSELQQQVVRIRHTTIINKLTSETPGTILNITKEGMDVATGQGVLRVLQLQLAGERVLPISDVINGQKNFYKVGMYFI